MRSPAMLLGCALALSLLAPGALGAPSRELVITEAPFRTFGRSVSVGFFVAVDPATTYRIVRHHERFPEYMPLIQEVQEVASKEGWARVRFRVRYLKLFDLVQTDERTFDPPRTVRWNSVEGPLKVSSGSWTVTPQDTGSWVVYQTDIDPGLPLPPALVGFLMRQGLPSVIEATRQRIESGGKYRKAS